MTLRPRLLVTRRLPEAVERRLADRYDAVLNPSDTPLRPATLAEAMTRFDALLPTISDRLGADILEVPGRTVGILGNYGAGVDHLDLAAARRAGIVVTNTPDVLTDATAEMAILLMLMAARRAGEGERVLRAGGFEGWNPTFLVGQSVIGKTLGLVGFGRIAQATARRAHHGFGMRIVFHSRTRAAPETEAGCAATYLASVAEVAADADVLSLHVPGGPATHHLIDADLLARMKPSAIVVNTARGTVIDEAALAAALASRSIAAAGLDVFEREPEVHPQLLQCENAVLLPHLGSATTETRVAMGMLVADNLDAFFAGRDVPNRVA